MHILWKKLFFNILDLYCKGNRIFIAYRIQVQSDDNKILLLKLTFFVLHFSMFEHMTHIIMIRYYIFLYYIALINQ